MAQDREAGEDRGELTRDDLDELKRLPPRLLSRGWSAIHGRVGEGCDEVSVAQFIAGQRAKCRVLHSISSALLGCRSRGSTSGSPAPPAGSPDTNADRSDQGWTISENTVADSMRRECLVA